MEKLMNMYEEQLCRKLNKLPGFRYEDIKELDKYPEVTAAWVLKILLQLACQAQNEANIILGRNKILEINYSWLKLHIMETAGECLDLSDEWEYRRFLELIILAVPDLKESVLALGENSQNGEVRQAAEDFRD